MVERRQALLDVVHSTKVGLHRCWASTPRGQSPRSLSLSLSLTSLGQWRLRKALGWDQRELPTHAADW